MHRKAPARRVHRARPVPVRAISPGTTALRTGRQPAQPTMSRLPRSRAASLRVQTVRARSPAHNQPQAAVRSGPKILLRTSRSRRLRRKRRKRSRSRQRRRRSRGHPRHLSRSSRRTSHNRDPRSAVKLRARRLRRNLVLHLRGPRGLRMHARPAVYPSGTRPSLSRPGSPSSGAWAWERRPRNQKSIRLLRLRSRRQLPAQ